MILTKKSPCADDKSCFEVFARECLTSNVTSRVKKLFIDSNFSDMVAYNNSSIWLRNYDKMENQGSLHVMTIPFDIVNKDAINSFYKSIDGVHLVLLLDSSLAIVVSTTYHSI